MDGLIRHYKTFGLRGLFAFSAHRLIGHPTEIAARPAGMVHPVYIRLFTTDVPIYEAILIDREYELDLPFYPRTILDAGANIGMASVFFANKYPGAKIVAVEAEADNFAMLVKNTRSYPTIQCVHAALWSFDGEIGVHRPDPVLSGGEWGFVVGAGSGTRAVTMRTLMREVGFASIDLLKVDIEGAEKEVFESADWAGKVRCLIIETHDRLKPGCSQAVSSAMRGRASVQKGGMTLFIGAS